MAFYWGMMEGRQHEDVKVKGLTKQLNKSDVASDARKWTNQWL